MSDRRLHALTSQAAVLAQVKVQSWKQDARGWWEGTLACGHDRIHLAPPVESLPQTFDCRQCEVPLAKWDSSMQLPAPKPRRPQKPPQPDPRFDALFER